MKVGALSTLALALLASCSGSGDSPGDSPSGKGPQAPVSSEPLAGTFAGESFVAKTAVARREFGASDGDLTRRIAIFDTEYVEDDCSTSPVRPREIALTVTWEAGSGRDFGGSAGQSATFVYVQEDRSLMNLVATDGRVEIVEAPVASGETGILRLRASAKEGFAVEGEIPVRMCK